MTTPNRPDIDVDALAERVADRFGLDGVLAPLPGERDRNFRLIAPGGEGYVVKVSSPDESDATLEFESALMVWLRGADGVRVPGVRPDDDGAPVDRMQPGTGGPPLRIRVLELLPGRPLAEVRPRTDALLEDLGRTVGALDRALADFPGRAPDRGDFLWALDRAGHAMDAGLEALDDPTRRGLVERARTAFEATADARATLPRQIVHGDVNDHNVLVGAGVTGVLDFGDAHEAPAVYDLAIAVAYALLDRPDPLQAAARVVAGYHRVRTLSADELALVVPLARARLAASVAISAARRARTPEPDPYLLVSEAPAWRALDALDRLPTPLATGVLRDACGLEPCPRAGAVRAWMAAHARQGPVAPVVDAGDDAPVMVLDLSVGSPLLTGRDTDDTAAFTRRVFAAMTSEGATLGVGRWGEPRGFYLTDAFAGRPSEMPERRTVHLGVDVFVEPGAAVRAVLPGRVVAVRDNAGRLDYGPTVVLEHDTPHGPVRTLYGHLERASVAELRPGATVEAGQVVARVGPYPENGDWPPHLHVQLLLDDFGTDGDFPGVAAPRERGTWLSFCPDPSPLLGLGVDAAWVDPDDAALEARRRRSLGPNLSLSYARPIHVVRGRGAHLFDVLGRAYLDGVNNVAHVGHEHPRVVEALARQARVLNTNTRYLHESVVAYAERLTALLPDPLSVWFFVTSGSEANELALRLARAHTGRRGVVALEGGYHGHTQALVDVSHYKFSRAGGQGAPPWVRTAPMPDDFRGRYRRDDPERAARYAADVGTAAGDLAAGPHGVSAFLAEAILSCGGQVVPPEGYLAEAYRQARAAGAVCIADEVQIGFGRVGSHVWGFETQGVAPDIVTLGKPIGNGHPLGAVVTTPDIAASFDNGMEFFSTFGGNPVSAAVGMAVLDVLDDEGLQEHARVVGGRILDGLTELVRRHPAVGDARGRGLFLGIELVADGPDGPSPAAGAARYVVERMKEKGILLSTDGPDGNVVKFKPPLPFSAADGDRMVEALDEVLGEDPVRAMTRG